MYVYKEKNKVQICFVAIVIQCHSPGLKWYCDRLDPCIQQVSTHFSETKEIIYNCTVSVRKIISVRFRLAAPWRPGCCPSFGCSLAARLLPLVLQPLAAGCCPCSAAPGGWLLPSFCCPWRLAAALVLLPLAAGCCPRSAPGVSITNLD